MTTQLAIIGSQSGSLTSSDGSRRALQRALGKADRRLLTDAIQEFAAYVDPSGEASTRPGMAFRNVTAMVYRPAGLNALQRRAKAAGQHARDAMSESELEFLRVAERTTADLLRLGMAEGRTRKAIKADVRVHVDRLAAVMRPSLELAKRYAAAVAEDLV
jgi:predicted TIM-barrel enzyme